MAKFEDILNNHFQNCFTSLKITSYDKENNVYMCQSKKQVIDFDNMTKKMNPKKQPSSPDALWSDEQLNQIYSVEFKNQDKAKVKNKKVQKKAEDGRKSLDDICLVNDVSLNNYTLIYCVVYKSNPNKREYRNRYDTTSIHFGLEKFEGIYFDKIVTNNIDFFTKLFIEKRRILLKKEKLE